jgi:glycosyltransferase involved in cell wall biosynthesis
MRLLLLTNAFPNPFQPTRGIFNRELTRALSKNHDIRVLAPIPWVDEWRAKANGALPADRRAVVDGVVVYYPRYYYTPKVLRGQYGMFMWHSVRRRVSDILLDFKPDAVIGYWIHPDGEAAVRAARLAGVPAVIMVGGSDVLVLTKHRGRRRRILEVLTSANAVVTVSRDLKERLVAFGIDADKVFVVYRGVDVAKFSPGDRVEARRRLGMDATGPVLLWVGRLVPVKALDVLLAACGLLRERRVPFHLYLVGDGPLRSVLAAKCEIGGLTSSVTFVGVVDHEDLPDWYRAADLVVLPSRSEGVPNVLREAHACGTPFVASQVGGIPEIAEAGYDQLVPPDDPSALANVIADALKEERSAPSAKNISWIESGEELVRVLEKIRSPNYRMT